jgi:hypothetical protein
MLFLDPKLRVPHVLPADLFQWGTRPLAIGYPGVHALNDWGQGGNDIMQEWSLHILGQKWQIT